MWISGVGATAGTKGGMAIMAMLDLGCVALRPNSG
jgi:hypothetical protein